MSSISLTTDELTDARAWRTLKQQVDHDTLLNSLTDSSLIERTRRAELLNQRRRGDEAMHVLASLPSGALSLIEATSALVMTDLLSGATPAERSDLLSRIVGLPEHALQDATFQEAQAKLDFARGQAYGELGNTSEARELLRMAQRGLQYLGFSDAPARAALERISGTPEERVRTHSQRLSDLLTADPTSLLIPAVAGDLAEAASKAWNLTALRCALGHMRPSPARESLRASADALLGHRGMPAPDEHATHLSLPQVANHLLRVERAILAEQQLDAPRAAELAAEALRRAPQFPVDSPDHNLILILSARALAFTDLPGAGQQAASSDVGVFSGLARLTEAEIVLRAENGQQAAHALIDEAYLLMEAYPDRIRLATLNVSRRVATNAYHLLAQRFPEYALRPPLVISRTLRLAAERARQLHRESLDQDPTRVVAFEWLVACGQSASRAG